ncbi:MAG: aldehyde ferredoxin oxidoreductase [Thermoprotei archaeon]|nr:MAG: aldehyde ferredoxin oxidoreductase [Thermoprotei archaeon]
MVFSYRALFIDVGQGAFKIEEFLPPEVLGPIDLGVKLHFEKYESWRYPVFSEKNVVVLGKGPFAGGRLFGTHRLVAVFRSPESQGLHVSTMGGAAYKFMRCGVDAVVVEGRSESPTVLLVEGDGENVRVHFEHLDPDELEKVYSGYGEKKGVYALTKYLADRYSEFISKNKARIIAVGPAAVKTIEGSIFSVDIDPEKKDFVPGAEDLAARGGGGSVLFRAHGVVALVVGGNFDPSKGFPKLSDIKFLDELSKKVLGKSYSEAVLGAVVKYRFDESMGTGGTFGVNYPHYKDLIPMFGFSSMYLTKEERMKLHSMIMEHFWKPFNDEVFVKSRSWSTCGEPCPAACKKVWRGKKVDYEPFNGLGPMVGVFKFELSAELVDLVDALGFDAIEIGHVVSWLMEAIEKGLLKPEELGLDKKPFFDARNFDLEKSLVNAEVVKKLVEGLVKQENEILKLIAEKGLRAAAKELDKKFSDRVNKLGIKFEDLAVYTPYGEEGYMTPNYYWTPGMVAPLFVLGRYWTNYTPTFMEPEDFAKASLTRAFKEYLVDNAGVCRFHRRWAEKLLPHLYKEILGVDVDLDEHAKKIYKRIAEYNKKAGVVPKFWEGMKSRDVVVSMASEMKVESWIGKFSKDPWGAAQEWWTRFWNKVNEILGL